ncbi:MAG: transcription antitermination factor NusB [Prevotellaceae bacterium]|jgi:N utilization substance protein B|nr:transcription antitermination factor NusB [Prevotellaceae bacterium]
MLTRALLRTKTAQVLYANFLSRNDVFTMQNELNFSLQKTYDLYHFLLLLPLEITKLARQDLVNTDKKLLKTDEFSSEKLAENIFIEKFYENKLFNDYIAKQKISWLPYQDELQKIFLKIKNNSRFYQKYVENETRSLEEDKRFWEIFFSSKVFFDDEFEDFLEDLSIYWLDDVGIVRSFAEQTIHEFDPDAADKKNILSMFKEKSDKLYVNDLAKIAFESSKNYDVLISNFLTSWELDRITKIDVVLLKMAICELKSFPEIPVRVTMNEYIEIAKFYGTDKSRTFINGVLDKIVKRMRETGTLNKLDEPMSGSQLSDN